MVYLRITKKSFTQKVVNCWNSLSQNVLMQTIYSFKSRLVKFDRYWRNALTDYLLVDYGFLNHCTTLSKVCGVHVTGVRNMAALGNVINWQKVDYDFNFHQQPFHTDILTLVLSEGKSILKVSLCKSLTLESG